MFLRWGPKSVVAALLLWNTAAYAASAQIPAAPSSSGNGSNSPQAIDSAAPKPQRPGLVPGPTAGVQKAQSFSGPISPSWLIGAGVVIGGVVLVTSSQNHGNASTTSTR